ncbi:DgyrCDS10143 [Dimorphilus gyrociliatus]|uniref:DgyrCDS10143 n=1 Tax=Dimorphilus gyrociliatus TaxID=2664684 RepID=A0A7I8VZC5_9ANNE|nr:DgyrCDS10143 [Dimorphilus gyrociliatus]
MVSTEEKVTENNKDRYQTIGLIVYVCILASINFACVAILQILISKVDFHQILEFKRLYNHSLGNYEINRDLSMTQNLRIIEQKKDSENEVCLITLYHRPPFDVWLVGFVPFIASSIVGLLIIVLSLLPYYTFSCKAKAIGIFMGSAIVNLLSSGIYGTVRLSLLNKTVGKLKFCPDYIVTRYETKDAEDLFKLLAGVGFCGIFVFPAFYSICLNGRHKDDYGEDSESQFSDSVEALN